MKRKFHSLLIVTIFCYTHLFSQYKWEVYEETYIVSKINGSIKNGFIMQTKSGNIYEVNDYVYLYEYLYNPDVLVLRKGEEYKLYIDGVKEKLLCRKLNDAKNNVKQNKSVIQSQISGNFEGFKGDSIFKLTNGQVWKQTQYYYYYFYYYMPSVMIYMTGSGYKMKVEGIDESVGVERIK